MKKKRVAILAAAVVILLGGTLLYRFVFMGSGDGTLPEEEPAAGTLTELPADAVLKTSTQTAYPGDYVAFSVTNAPNAKLSADLDGEQLQLSSCVINGTLVGVLAIPLENITLSTLTINAGNLSAVVEIHAKAFETAVTEVPTETNATEADKDMQNYSDAISKGQSAPLWSKLFVIPVQGNVLASFGASLSAEGNVVGQNGGVNIEAAEGTVVAAANDGIVVFAGEMSTGGNTVIISHGMGVFSLYQHMKDITVTADAAVKQGDGVGTVGSTGYVTAPQLYFSIIVANAPVDPFLMTIQDPLDILK
jgi:murein DD-endopeptidase MepM/ murein hydrolase activator NlpD